VVADLERRQVRGARHAVGHERAREELPVLVVHRLLPERLTDALREAAVHLPVDDSEFDDNPNIYENREPYGVVNIGSELEDCPVGQFLLPGRTPDLLAFQHRINKILAEGYLNDRSHKSR